MADYEVVYEPPEGDSQYEVVEPPPEPISENGPLLKAFGQDKAAVGSKADMIARHRKGISPQQMQERIVNSQLTDYLSGTGNFDGSDTFESANGYLSLFNVSRSNLNTEKYAKFKNKFPNGELLFVPTDEGVVPVARASSEQPFRRLGNVGPVASTIASPQTAIGVAAGVMTGGMSIPVSMGVQALAGAGASAIDNSIEWMQGYQDDSVASMVGDAGKEAAFNAMPEPVARYLTGAKSAAKTADIRSLESLANSGSEVPILKGQIGNPIKTALFKFVARMSPQAKRAIREQRSTLRNLVVSETDMTPEMLATMNNENLANYMELQAGEIILGKIGVTGAERYSVGVAQQAAVRRFKDSGREATNNLYEDALSTGRNEFWNARPLQTFTKDAVMPVVGAKASPRNSRSKDVVLSAPLNRELASITDAIMALDPTIGLHKGNSGIKQLMTLRTRVGDLMGEDLPSDQSKVVADLYGQLTDTIKNAHTGSPAFVAKWQAANDAYHDYQTFLRFGQTKTALNSMSPEKVADKFMQPGQYDFFKMLKTNLNADPQTAPAWEALKRGFIERYTVSTDKLAKARKDLVKYGSDELNLLLSKEEQRTLQMASHQAEQILNGPVAKMLKEFNDEGSRILEFAAEGNKAEIDRLVRLAGGTDSDVAAAMRAGVFQNLVNASEEASEETGQLILDPKKLSVAIKEMRQSKRLNGLFREEDWKRFMDWERVTAVIGKSSDDGSSIQAGEVAADLAAGPITLVSNPVQLGKLFLKLGFQDTLGYVLSRPESFEKLLRGASNMEAKQRDRAAVNATWQMLENIQETYSDREDLTPMQEGQREIEKVKERPWLWDYLKGAFGEKEEESTTAPPPPAPGPQGSLPAPAAPGNMRPPTNMAQAMPQQPPAAPAQQGIAGMRYSAMFPGDTLGALAASGGIASLKG